MPALKNARHERFAQAYAVKSNAAAAWRKATGKKANANVLGSKWLAIVGIKERVAEIKAKADALSEAGTVLTILESRQFLARVVRTPLGEITKDSDLCQEWVITEGEASRSERIKMPSKLDAIKLDRELAPENDSKGFEIIIRKL